MSRKRREDRVSGPRGQRLWLDLLVIGFAGCLMGTGASAGMPDWGAVADVETVEVVTTDEDGSSRETTVWLLVQEGEAYLRTGNTSWGDNVVRTGRLILRIGENEMPLRVEFVEDEAARERLTQGFREKYGWSDAMLGWIRGSHPRLMHLVTR